MRIGGGKSDTAACDGRWGIDIKSREADRPMNEPEPIRKEKKTEYIRHAMDLSRHEQWHAREYHRCVYERALDRYEDRPEDANLVYELVWAFAEAEAHPMPDGGIPLAAFPLDCYDLLVALPEAVAIGWTRELLKKLALERGRSVVMFEEGGGELGSRVVVYFGGNRFFSFANLLEALGFLFEYWRVEPSEDDRDRDRFGVQVLRANLRWEYEQAEGHEAGIRRGWDWLGNV
ncbi:hypothetical protein EV368DRAFT_69980 [Lentinula lateritia]|nr:hypothetical protein EV368DRAFT_69980 [Lentinula lateritia]